MAKPYKNNYWETEQSETVEFGNGKFMRYFESVGKLQFGIKFRDQRSGEDVYAVKFVLDREELVSNEQAAAFLQSTIQSWPPEREG